MGEKYHYPINSGRRKATPEYIIQSTSRASRNKRTISGTEKEKEKIRGPARDRGIPPDDKVIKSQRGPPSPPYPRGLRGIARCEGRSRGGENGIGHVYRM